MTTSVLFKYKNIFLRWKISWLATLGISKPNTTSTTKYQYKNTCVSKEFAPACCKHYNYFSYKRWGHGDRLLQRARRHWTNCPPAGWTRCVSRPECEWTGCFCWRDPGRWRSSKSATVRSGWASASASPHLELITLRHHTRRSSTWEDAPGPRAPQVRLWQTNLLISTINQTGRDAGYIKKSL